MRVALFGGTFDPIHWGHLLLAEAARDSFRLDRVLFVPAGTPPHKRSAIASAADRLRMVRLAIRGNRFFDADPWEIRQKRVVYSYETIAYFAQRLRGHRLFFIVGTDMLKIIRHWREGDSLLDRCTFLAAERPENPWTSLPPAIRRKSKRIEWSAVSLASHDIRARVRRGKSIRYQVPEAVERYVYKRGLYKSPQSPLAKGGRGGIL